MKTFKQFVNDGVVNKNKNGVPTAIVDFGKRSGKPFKTTNAIIDFGNRKGKPKLNEDADGDSPWIEHHNENAAYGGTHHEQHNALHASQTNNKLGEHSQAYSKWSADLNKSLLKHSNEGREHPKTFQDDIHHYDLKKLDEEIAEHKLPHKLHVYSGVGFDPQKLSSAHPEGHIHLPAYTSSSINKDIAREFASGAAFGKNEGRHILHMELPKGHTGKYLGENSENYHESEFMLPRGMTIKVHPNPKKIKRLGREYHVHKATVVPKEEKERHTSDFL